MRTALLTMTLFAALICLTAAAGEEGALRPPEPANAAVEGEADTGTPAAPEATDGVLPEAPAAEAAESPATETAAAPKQPETPKNFHRFTLGDMEIFSILDASGVRNGPVAILIGAGDDDLRRANEKDGLKTSINAFVAKMAGKTILFDTGLPVAESGGIPPALKAAGIQPEDVDAVVISHFHHDHVGGLVDGGKAVYPNAELYLPEAEVNKWSEPGLAFLGAYAARTNVFREGREILPGVTALAAHGHTPGHTVFLLSSGDGEILILADLIHLPGVQLANPDLAVTYDKDPARAVAARKRIFAMAAERELPVAGMHIPFPGTGILERSETGYVLKPLEQ